MNFKRSYAYAVALLVILAVLPGTHAVCSRSTSSGRRRLSAEYITKPVIAAHPDAGATKLVLEVAFDERSNKVTGSKVWGSYSHLLHDQEFTTPCVSQATAAPYSKTVVDPQPEWRSTWIPEALDSVKLHLQSSKVCAAPVLSADNSDYIYSRLDVSVTSAETPELTYNKGSCIVALSMNYDKEHGCACHCFEGHAIVNLSEKFSRVEGSKQEMLSCTRLQRDPALGCTCSMCPAAAT